MKFRVVIEQRKIKTKCLKVNITQSCDAFLEHQEHESKEKIILLKL